jgi:hypothetical protein
MYKINRTENDVTELKAKKFGELKIREREHLQERIAKNPEMLGEELLIIQKEFDGFSETSERLDLLALDKDGNLIVIENKLDDSGRNVVWQALKYASYCSTLTDEQIIDIYGNYLKRFTDSDAALAKENIMEFLNIESEDDLLLNKYDQRIMFVANEYRKEVTSTVLWLLNHDIKLQCFRAVPYSLGEDVFLQMEQIIPLPETEEYMIEIKEKQKEVSEKSQKVAKTESILSALWKAFQQDLKDNNIDFLDNVSVSSRFYTGFGRGAGYYGYSLGSKTIRVELYLSKDEDKKFIDGLIGFKSEIESKLDNITWERLEGKKASRLKLELPRNQIPQGGFRDEINWPFYINWFRDSMNEFYEVVNPIWGKVQKEVR